jgi:hypothetical protein
VKSGKQLVKAALRSRDRQRFVASLKNGELRSLSLRLKNVWLGDEIGEQIMACCMAELMVRFLAKGKEIL